jgi:2-polyprenyl-3-methyl-5-hydroxy-6-metoxy-1,4-benzoquinol methylase
MHAHLIPEGARVLDLACGTGHHGLACAALGAEVTAVDKDPARLEVGRRMAKALGVTVTWLEWDLSGPLPPLGTFDVLLLFNYLDRARMPAFIDYLRPGGILMMETFLEDQRSFDWGPTSDDHLLRRGEVSTLVEPLRVIFGREALEPVEGVNWSAVASVVAKKVH